MHCLFSLQLGRNIWSPSATRVCSLPLPASGLPQHVFPRGRVAVTLARQGCCLHPPDIAHHVPRAPCSASSLTAIPAFIQPVGAPLEDKICPLPHRQIRQRCRRTQRLLWLSRQDVCCSDGIYATGITNTHPFQ